MANFLKLNQMSSEDLNARLAEICLATLGGRRDHFLVEERFKIQTILRQRYHSEAY